MTLSQQRLQRLHEVMSGYVERGVVPGIVALISKGNEVHVSTIGALALDGTQPMPRDAIFRISSMTKQITAVAAMILIEECRLRLDDAADGLLPELAGRRVLKRLDGPVDDTVPAVRPITVRDLLTYRLGFGGIVAPGDYPIQQATREAFSGSTDPDDWLRRFSTLPLMHQPGEKWMYSTGSDVLGVLIARASGQPLEAFLRERIFEPLGMSDTGYTVPADKLGRLATSYWTDPVTGALTVNDEVARGDWTRPPAVPSAAGEPNFCMVSTVDDYHTFLRMLLHKGRPILSRPAVEVMTTDQLTPQQKAVSGLLPGYFDSHGWGLGLSVVTRRDDLARSVGTFGWDGGLGTSGYADPVEDMVTILMTQAAWTSPRPPPICADFSTLAYQSLSD